MSGSQGDAAGGHGSHLIHAVRQAVLGAFGVSVAAH